MEPCSAPCRSGEIPKGKEVLSCCVLLVPKSLETDWQLWRSAELLLAGPRTHMKRKLGGPLQHAGSGSSCTKDLPLICHWVSNLSLLNFFNYLGVRCLYSVDTSRCVYQDFTCLLSWCTPFLCLYK